MDASLARLKRGLWPAVCVLVFFAYLATVPRTWQCEGTDEIEYLGLAHSMVRGEGYTLYGSPFVLYPPLFSFLLSWIVRMDVTAWHLMYLMNAAIGFAGLVLVATYVRRSGPAGRVASWLSLFSYYAWSFSTRYLMADQLFTLCAGIALIAAAGALREEGRRQGARLGLVALFALLAAMTRASSVVLVAALVLSAVAVWSKNRSRAAISVAAVCLFAAAFIAYWEVRAVMADPNAPESYARWGLKMLGLSPEKTGFIATNIGMGTTHATTWPERALTCAVTAGQYIASMPRRPSNAEPLAVLLFALFLTGAIRALPRSPFAWYALLSALLISLTSWYTDYPRYLYALTPLLFYFAAEGVSLWRDSLARPSGRWLVGLLICWAGAGLLYSWRAWPFGTGSGSERICTTLLGGALVALYLAVLLSLVRPWYRTAGCAWSARATRAAVSVLVVGCFMNALALAGARASLTRQNETLNYRRLTGCVEAGLWLKQNTPAGVRCVSSVPRLVSFLADRTFRGSEFDASGRLDLRGVDYVLLTGELCDVHLFRADREEVLRRAVEAEAGRGNARLAFAFGDAAVYNVIQEK